MTSEEEASRIMESCEGSFPQAMGVVERQFNTLHSRAQVLFSFCGIVITVTGFSGRLIAATNRPAQVLVVSGLAVVIGCAFYLYHNVMTLRWATQRLEADGRRSLVNMLRWRDHKTTAYRRGGYLLFVGLLFYGAAIAIMLLNPEPMQVPVR